MKSKEEQNPTYLHLCLPLVEVTDNNPRNLEHYEESGTYFIKTLDGVYSIVEVSKKDNSVWSNPLPVSIGNLFEQDQAALAIKEELKGLLTRLEEVVVSTAKQAEERIESRGALISEQLSEIIAHEGVVGNSLRDILEGVYKQSETQQPSMTGFVSQETLVEILRTIK